MSLASIGFSLAFALVATGCSLLSVETKPAEAPPDPGPLVAVPCPPGGETLVCFDSENFRQWYVCEALGICPDREGIDTE